MLKVPLKMPDTILDAVLCDVMLIEPEVFEKNWVPSMYVIITPAALPSSAYDAPVWASLGIEIVIPPDPKVPVNIRPPGVLVEIALLSDLGVPSTVTLMDPLPTLIPSSRGV